MTNFPDLRNHNFLQLVLLCLLFVSSGILAQKKTLTLEEIWSGAFAPKRMQSLHSMKDGYHYTVLERKGKEVEVNRFSYETLEKVETILISSELAKMETFVDYTFSTDERRMMLATDLERVYRYSRRGHYYMYDRGTQKVSLIYEDKIQEPTFSPDDSKVGFSFDNNLYVKDLETGEITRITTDGKKDHVINGITDWVYEEEFGFVRAFDWNKSGDRIAYIRFDESEVPEFSMDIYGKALYPSKQVFKYPKAGEKNSKVGLFVHDLRDGSRVEVPLDNYHDFYIPRIQWTQDPDVLSLQVINRHQNKLDIILYHTQEKTTKVVLTETDQAYVDVTDNLTFLEDNSFLWASERDGYNHLYHFDVSGTLKHQVTRGPWEVTAFYGYDPDSKRVFYQSAEEDSIYRDVYSIRLNGKKKQKLTEGKGNHMASFSEGFTFFINTFSNATTPHTFSLHRAKDGKLLKSIIDNQELVEKISTYDLGTKEFFTLTTENGDELNAWMLKPSDFDPNTQYPLLMHQYSGPGSQQVVDRWGGTNDMWFQFLAEQGYLVVCVDGRGTGFKGRDFKKVTYKELGKYEVEDQIAAARILGGYSYIDASRIGIWGWSYGGFMSSNCILKGNDVFSMAIAVAPVTSWRFYDTIYTERYMRTPQENASGYDYNSPINHADKLKGAYLIVHGSGDDNVHVQNTMRMVEALVQANKQFDMAIYPDRNHRIYGGKTRLQLYEKMTQFIRENL